MRGPWAIDVVDVEEPKPPPGWALVRVELAGICGTDKAFYTGSYKLLKTPLVPGHEAVGVVVEGPEGLVGARVVPEINFPCWSCEYCKAGLYTHCPSKKTLGIDFDGTMAEYFVAPPSALHLFPGSPERGVFVEPLAAVLRALSARPLVPGARVAVIGTGNVAWLTVQVLRNACGVEVHLVAREGSVKARRYEGLVDRVVYVSEVPASRYEAVFEVSGDSASLDLAIKAAKPRGVIYLKSTPGSLALVNTTLAVVKEVEIVCTRCGTSREFQTAIELLTSGVITPILDKTYSLAEVKKAFDEALRPEYFKVAIRP